MTGEASTHHIISDQRRGYRMAQRYLAGQHQSQELGWRAGGFLLSANLDDNLVVAEELLFGARRGQ